MLAQRILSGAILLPLILGVVYWGVGAVALLVAVAVVVGLVELYGAIGSAGFRPRVIPGIVSGLLFCGAAFFQRFTPVDLAGAALCSALLLVLVGELFRGDHRESLSGWAFTVVGACYVGWLLSYYILLRALDVGLHEGWLVGLGVSGGAAWVYLVLFITWAQDTAAFFVGRSLGRHRLAPTISPGKSWEGVVGGLVAAILVALLMVPLFGLPVGYGVAVVLGMVGAGAGVVGDLCVSLVKRQSGLKDMGSLVPGHGGILDRMDSMLFTAPILYYLIVIMT